MSDRCGVVTPASHGALPFSIRPTAIGFHPLLSGSQVSQFLHAGDPMRKTIIFCENVPHAERMRSALAQVDLNRGLVLNDHRYVMRITGDEREGKTQLDNFINPKESYPVIATTSQLMTTGVAAQTCHLIVLDRRILSMTEFKQIIGRGTRLRPDYDKNFFTIIDFRGATQLFEDPDWDGPPIQDQEFGEAGELVDRDRVEDEAEDGTVERIQYRVSHQEFEIQQERISYYDKNGDLTTESLKDYTRRTVSEAYQSLDRFLSQWNAVDRKQAILDELLAHGVIPGALEEMVGQEYDLFDLVCHVAFDRPPLTRRERAERVRKRDVFAKYGETARAVLVGLLNQYADQGVVSIEERTVLQLEPFSRLGTPVELINSFGGKQQYQAALRELEQMLYEDKGA